MTKAMFGIAAALAVGISPAWAGDEKSDEKATNEPAAAQQSEGKSKNVSVAESTARGVEAGRDSAAVEESNEVRTSAEGHDDRWLRMREGYRDGGY